MSKQIIELSLIEERNCELIIKTFLDLTDSKKVEFIKVNDVIQEIKISKGTFYKNSLVHVRDEKVSLYRYFRDFSSHDSAI